MTAIRLCWAAPRCRIHCRASLEGTRFPRSQRARRFRGCSAGWLRAALAFPISPTLTCCFCTPETAPKKNSKNRSGRFSQDLWDLRLKLSPATRTLAECGRFEAANSEFAISLLDCRYLAGDHRVFARLHDDVIPKLLARESEQDREAAGELTRARHGKFGGTVFHLEPNVKDGPGGLRDYNVVCWLSLLAAIEQYHGWPSDDAVLSASIQESFGTALNALMSIRCFLHFRHNRDDNTLTWESQDAAAAQKIGVAHSPRTIRATSDRDGEPLSTAEWMRFTSATRARCIMCACKCWRRFRRHAFRSITNFSNCARAFRTRNFWSRTGCCFCGSPRPWTIPS